MIPILVDCTEQGANQELLKTYQIRGFPTLLFVGSDGRRLGTPPNREAATLVQMMNQFGSPAPAGSPSKAPALAILIAILIAVPIGLILLYKKVIAPRMEEES